LLRLCKLRLNIVTIETDSEIQSCFNVLVQLRAQLKEEMFLDIMRKQFKRGYQLVAVKSEGNIVAVAGFHFQENLAWGKHLYIEDLITDKNTRSLGVGQILLNWLQQKAKKNDCRQVHLDSGTQRKDAHRFYEREGMLFSSQHYMSKV